MSETQPTATAADYASLREKLAAFHGTLTQAEQAALAAVLQRPSEGNDEVQGFSWYEPWTWSLGAVSAASGRDHRNPEPPRGSRDHRS